MEVQPPPTDPLLVKYCDTFWDNFDAAVKQADTTRAELKQFMTLIEARVKIESTYSEKLYQLSKIEPKVGRVGLTYNLIQAYSASLKKKADQSKNFAHLLGQTGLDKLTHFYETLGTETKKLKEQGRIYLKQLLTVEQEYQKVLRNVIQSLFKTDKRKKELDELQLHFLISATCKELAQKKASLKVKTKQKQKEYTEVSKQCKSIYSSYVKIKKSFEKNTRHILQTYFDYEKDKLQRMIDSFVNIQLIQSSECKNRLVYLEEESKFINNVQPQSELERFIESFKSPSQLAMINKPSFKQSFLHFTFERLDSKKIEEVIKYGDNHKVSIKKILQDPASLSEQQSNNISPQPLSIANYIRKMWENILLPQDTMIFEQQVNNQLSRKDFVICLQQQRIIGKFQINSDNLSSLVNTISIVLNKCYEQRDSYVAKHILVLLFTYFTNVKQGETVKKQYLHSFLKSHNIWKSMEFWQSALIQTLYQKSKGNQQMTALSLKGLLVNNQKQQNLLFNQLVIYTHNMILFDWEQKYVKQFANKFIKLYNLQESLGKKVFDTIEVARKTNSTNHPVVEEIVQNHQTPSVISTLVRMFSQTSRGE